MQELSHFRDFFEQIAAQPLLDIRSPAEFVKGHIPGAISFPLFSNEERAQIGRLYKRFGKRKALKVGLDLVGPKMSGFVDAAESLDSNRLCMYCWRGGMRSSSMGWLLEQAGFDITIIKGGYKAYRRELHKYFDDRLNLRVVSGYTGSRKTDFLKMLKELGAQIVDLEALAKHQGSSFGNQKSSSQPTTEQFQNLTFAEFCKLDRSRPIWIEDECLRIGQVMNVERLHEQKEQSPHVFIEIPKSERIDFLVRDYGGLGKDKLIKATKGIQRKLGGLRTKMAIGYIESGELGKAVNIVLEYYDRQYKNAIVRKASYIASHHKIGMDDLRTLAAKLMEQDAIQVNRV